MRFGRLSAAVLSLAMLVSAGCKQSGSGFLGRDAIGPATRHQLTGTVLGVSPSTDQVDVAQQAIHGFLPAADAVYKLAQPAQLGGLRAGDRIEATVVADQDGDPFQLQNVIVTAQPGPGFTPAMVPAHQLMVGEAVPDVPLRDQDDAALDFSKLHGKAVLVTFIDTKCTEDCPIITRLFGKIDALLRENPSAYAKTDLVSVSLDTANDTPPVLRRYGLSYMGGKAAGFRHWQFVDLTAANLQRLAKDFGVIYQQKGDDIEHTMIIALIGPDGRLVQEYPGDDWDANELAKAAAASALAQPAPAATPEKSGSALHAAE